MRTRTLVFTLVPALLLTGVRGATAQKPDMSDPDFSQAVLALVTHDHFATKCAAGKGMSAGDAAQVEAWRSTHRVELVRARLRELENDPAQKPKIDEAYAAVVRKYGQLNLWACRAALQSTKRPEAKFAERAPRMLAALDEAPAASAVTATRSTPRPDGATTSEASVAAAEVARAVMEPSVAAPSAPTGPPRGALMEQLDSFGFDTRAKMGIGGFMALDIYPIVLFRGGELLLDVTGLSFPQGLEAHRRAHPEQWSRWRREGGTLQLSKDGAWKAPSFQKTYARLPDGYRLDGLFRLLSGAGTVAVGGTQSVVAWTDYRFSADGAVERTGGAGGRAEAGDASVATSSVAPNRRGRYRIDGLMLRITYDDGSVESRILIADPTDPKTAIWLDGVGYVRRSR
jgi:hypothetical protein